MKDERIFSPALAELFLSENKASLRLLRLDRVGEKNIYILKNSNSKSLVTLEILDQCLQTTIPEIEMQ